MMAGVTASKAMGGRACAFAGAAVATIMARLMATAAVTDAILRRVIFIRVLLKRSNVLKKVLLLFPD
jgi:hypothetical protein